MHGLVKAILRPCGQGKDSERYLRVWKDSKVLADDLIDYLSVCSSAEILVGQVGPFLCQGIHISHDIIGCCWRDTEQCNDGVASADFSTLGIEDMESIE